MFEWCNYNKLDINWSKTYLMFITNKRIVMSKQITIRNVSVQVVEDFKLLGITLDNKLNFANHSSLLKKIINRKLFSIKKQKCFKKLIKSLIIIRITETP